MSIVSALKGRGPSGFGYGSTTDEVTAGLDLTGRRVLVTGCNSGLGLETMRALCSRGATVLGAARDLKKAQAACASVAGATVPVVCEPGEYKRVGGVTLTPAVAAMMENERVALA